MNISLQRMFVWRTSSVHYCIQVRLGTCFTVSHFFSFRWRDSLTKKRVPSLWRSTSEPTPVSAVAAERASSSCVCASEKSCATYTVPYRIFDIRSLGGVFFRNSYRTFVSSLLERDKTKIGCLERGTMMVLPFTGSSTILSDYCPVM